MKIQLTDEQIKTLISQTVTETEREIYSLVFNDKRIKINGDWSIERDKTKTTSNDIIAAIKEYCTRSNIEWEYNSEYSAWCD